MLRDLLVQTKGQAHKLRLISADLRSLMLATLADAVERHSDVILHANDHDCQEYEGAIESSLLQRLALTPEKMRVLVDGIRDLFRRSDPLGSLLARTQLDDGLILYKVSVPLGVVGVIFESRPDVFLQVLALALRTGNGIVLKGGKEASRTIGAMAEVTAAAFENAGFSSGWFLLLEGREAVTELLRHDDLVDLIIPRGSNEFVRYIQESSRIPVLAHAAGVCHLYVHSTASRDEACAVILDAKTQYPAACNSVETVLIDSEISEAFVPVLVEKLRSAGVVTRGCVRVSSLVSGVEPVLGSEWGIEYGSMTIALRVVQGAAEAIEHINAYGSHHTDGILAEDESVIATFLEGVDSSSVFANCSTRFADGYRYGFGAEIGIGTGKLHARGPVGLEGLLTYKYILRGKGHRVESYTGPDARRFSFAKLA